MLENRGSLPESQARIIEDMAEGIVRSLLDLPRQDESSERQYIIDPTSDGARGPSPPEGPV